MEGLFSLCHDDATGRLRQTEPTERIRLEFPARRPPAADGRRYYQMMPVSHWNVNGWIASSCVPVNLSGRDFTRKMT